MCFSKLLRFRFHIPTYSIGINVFVNINFQLLTKVGFSAKSKELEVVLPVKILWGKV